jgi:hypothetical protein
MFGGACSSLCTCADLPNAKQFTRPRMSWMDFSRRQGVFSFLVREMTLSPTPILLLSVFKRTICEIQNELFALCIHSQPESTASLHEHHRIAPKIVMRFYLESESEKHSQALIVLIATSTNSSTKPANMISITQACARRNCSAKANRTMKLRST